MVQSSSRLDYCPRNDREFHGPAAVRNITRLMATIRFTIIDASSTITFLAPPHALKAFAAACAHGAETTLTLISGIERYDAELSRHLRAQLGVFQEHNVARNTTWIANRLETQPDHPDPVVVLDDQTRELSQRPGPLGLIVINLPAKRFVQVQNNCANLERSDRGRLRRNGQPIRTLYHYTLPDEWTIVP